MPIAIERLGWPAGGQTLWANSSSIPASGVRGKDLSCPASVAPAYRMKSKTGHGWDCIITFDGEPILPGQRRMVAFHFLSGAEARAALLRSHRFFLWERGFIGEVMQGDTER